MNKEQRFLKMLEQHRKSIYRICWGFSKEQETVEDLFQDSMVNIWKSLDSFKGKSSEGTWIYRIALNTCLMWNRKKKVSGEWKDVHLSYRPEEQMELNESILQLKNAIQELNKLDRGIILLVLEEKSYSEIAEITGLNTNQIGVRIHRIKATLKKKLEHVI